MGGELQTRDVAAGAAGRGRTCRFPRCLAIGSERVVARCWRPDFGAVVPFTLIVIMPTNHTLLGIDPDTSSVESRDLLIRWGKLHAVRTVLGLLAATLMLWQLAAGS
jgi:Anthrone oxygenase